MDDFKEFRLPIFGGFPALGASTRFLTKTKYGHCLSEEITIPRTIDPSQVVKDVAERQGYSYTEDNHVVYKGLVTKSS